MESRELWKDHVYGKCYCCGEGYSKDDWRFQATMFEEANEGVYHMEIVDLFLEKNKTILEDVDGNGLCSSCAQEVFGEEVESSDESSDEESSDEDIGEEMDDVGNPTKCQNCNKTTKTYELKGKSTDIWYYCEDCAYPGEIESGYLDED
eukprot:SAG31_NODE_14102_length_827_cov_0.949176_1_plen_149_part_00